MTPTYETVTLPAVPASAGRRAELLDAGYAETAVGDVLVFSQRSPAPAGAGGAPAPPAEPEPAADGPVTAQPTLLDALAEVVGDRPARALADAGYPSLAQAREAVGRLVRDGGHIAGVGPATIAKLS